MVSREQLRGLPLLEREGDGGARSLGGEPLSPVLGTEVESELEPTLAPRPQAAASGEFA
jgi:hypothetical protein